MRQTGSAIGVALFGSLLGARHRRHAGAMRHRCDLDRGTAAAGNDDVFRGPGYGAAGKALHAATIGRACSIGSRGASLPNSEPSLNQDAGAG